MTSYDYIIVGSGIAGLYTALLARKYGTVAILTKGKVDDCNTKFAQGGIAAAIGPYDSPALHVKDTLVAGAGLCNRDAVAVLAQDGPERIADLIRMGVSFDTFDGEIALAREGAHTVARVLHAGGDATGEHIELTLANLAVMSGVTVLEYTRAVRVLMDHGVAVGIELQDAAGRLGQIDARSVILATGGAGNLYRFTTNPPMATGDGVALAFQAGAEVVDMEFFQFHPTALSLTGASVFLISEAVRGEGGVLRNVHGERFMGRLHPLGEMAPRDIVSRAIVQEMEATQQDHVVLDITHVPSSRITTRFPSIYRFCLAHGLDITITPIPVAPAAHYMMGGIKTNVWGETNVAGLYACGEVASSGVHGANRLASNSLLDTLVFGKRLIEAVHKKDKGATHNGSMEETEDLRVVLPIRSTESVPASSVTLDGLQHLMWASVGIVRDEDDLISAAGTLAKWQNSIPDAIGKSSIELKSLVLASRLVTEAALLRRESRGAHYRRDFPEASDEWRKHIVLIRPE
jgi:L-aspartate oxidase